MLYMYVEYALENLVVLTHTHIIHALYTMMVLDAFCCLHALAPAEDIWGYLIVVNIVWCTRDRTFHKIFPLLNSIIIIHIAARIGYMSVDSERVRQGSAAAGFNITQDFRRTYTHYYYII